MFRLRLVGALLADIDLKGNVLRVERGWDDKEGEQDVKTDAGRRRVPLASRVRRELAAHKLRTGRGGDDLVFGRTAALPFTASTVRSRSRRVEGRRARGPYAARGAPLRRELPHRDRREPELSEYIGHSDIRTTFNRHGHLMPGNEAAAAAKLDALIGDAGPA